MINRMLGLFAATVMLVAAGCDAESSQGSADCSQQIEHRGARYTESGFTKIKPEKFRRVVDVPCFDSGGEPEADAPTEYRTALRFPSFDASEVLAVAVEDGLYRVMLSDALSDSRASAILHAVGVE